MIKYLNKAINTIDANPAVKNMDCLVFPGSDSLGKS